METGKKNLLHATIKKASKKTEENRKWSELVAGLKWTVTYCIWFSIERRTKNESKGFFIRWKYIYPPHCLFPVRSAKRRIIPTLHTHWRPPAAATFPAIFIFIALLLLLFYVMCFIELFVFCLFVFPKSDAP